MRRLITIVILLLSLAGYGQDVKDYQRTRAAGKTNVIDAYLEASHSLAIPKGSAWSLNSASDSVGYIFYNTTLGKFGVYVGGGVWKEYATLEELNAGLAIVQDSIADLRADKVDKVPGKQLSTEDFSTAEKSKLSGIADGATANSTDAQLRDRSTHTGTQAPGTIVQDASNRFVTDAEKASWTTKQDALGFTPENVANKGVANGYASLNALGQLPNSQIPPLALVQTFVRSSEADMLLLSAAEQGDVCIRTDLSKTFILTDANYNTLSSWKELLSPVIPAETDPGVPAYAKSLSSFSVIQASTDALYKPIGYAPSWGDITGTVPTWNQNTTGNAATATNWGGWTANFSGVGTAPSYMLGAEGGVVRAYDISQFQTALGITGGPFLPVASPAFTGSLTGPNATLTEHVSINRSGSNVLGSGPYFQLGSNSSGRYWLTQMNASFGIDTYHYTGAVWSKYKSVDASGNHTWTGNGIIQGNTFDVGNISGNSELGIRAGAANYAQLIYYKNGLFKWNAYVNALNDNYQLASPSGIPLDLTPTGDLTLLGTGTFGGAIANTVSSGVNIDLTKASGAAIQLNKTGQAWQISGEDSFKLYDITTGTTPFQVAKTTGNLTLIGTGTFGAGVTIKNSVSTTSTAFGGLTFQNTYSTPYDLAKISVETGSQFYYGDIVFKTAQTGFAGVLSEKVRITQAGTIRVSTPTHAYLVLNSASTSYEAGIIFQNGGTDKWELFKGSTTNDFLLYNYNTASYPLTVSSTNNSVTLSSLIGSGTRMVVADNTGKLSTQAIPSGGGGGTVVTVSVNSANGFAGTSSGGDNPALTLSTTVTGLLKGNGTAISAAVAGTDYVTPSGSITGNAATATFATTAGAANSVAWTNVSGRPTAVSSFTNDVGYLTSFSESDNLTTVTSASRGTPITDADITVDGTLYAVADVIAYYSDERLKRDITSIPDPLGKLQKLRGVYYYSNDTADRYGIGKKERQVGFLASEVQAVLPEVVALAPFDRDPVTGLSKSGQNYITVQYDRILPLVVEAVNTHTDDIERLIQEVINLKDLISKM